MKKLRALPIPFLILILAGVVSLFSVFTGPGTPASGAQVSSLQAQAVQQQRAATVYFRVLSWLSDVTAPRDPQPGSTVDAPMSARHAVKITHGVACPSRIEFCSLHLAQTIPARRHRQALN
jgi:hypothetical protein